jgi:hypothetical protein
MVLAGTAIAETKKLPNGHYDGATTVTHEVCSLLTEELKHVFSGLPSGDGAF